MQILNKFSTSTNTNIISILELNNVKLESYYRNLRIEDLKCLRSIESLALSNVYLLYAYLKDIYFIFLHIIVHINDELVLKEKEKEVNCFLYNTSIEENDLFLDYLKNLLKESFALKEETREEKVEEKNDENIKREDLEKEGEMNRKESNSTVHHDNEKTNHIRKKDHFIYRNDCLQQLYTKEQMIEYNIDLLIKGKLKKEENNIHRTRVGNSISIYKASYLYFNDKLKRIRLDYNFHSLLLKKEVSDNPDDDNRKKTHLESRYSLKEQMFLIYASHFKFYLFSFFLYSYMKYIGKTTCRNAKEEKEERTRRLSQNKFFFNYDDNIANMNNVTSFLFNFIKNVLIKMDILLTKKKESLEREKRSTSELNGSKEKKNIKEEYDTYEKISELFRSHFEFQHITLEYIDLILSCMVLLNIHNSNKYSFHFTISHNSLNYLLKNYHMAINLAIELKRRNYWRLFEDTQGLCIIQKLAIYVHLKNIRIDYIYSLLYGANNKNLFSLKVEFIDTCLHIHNIERTKYLLESLSMNVEQGRITFNMSNKINEQEKKRCFLLDNKLECLKKFSEIYEDSIEDYAYMIFQESSFNATTCFFKYDIPRMICFMNYV